MRFKRPHGPEHIGSLKGFLPRRVERNVLKHIRWPNQHAFRNLEPAAMTLGGPSNRVHLALSNPTGISGPLCEPRIQPSTSIGTENGSSTSPTAGNPLAANHANRIVLTDIAPRYQ